MTPRIAPLARTAIAAAFVLAAAPAPAEIPPWGEGSYAFIARDDSLGKVLRTFAGSFGLAVDFAEGVATDAQVASGRLAAATPTEFLNNLGAAHGFTWFYQAGTLFVSRVSDRETRALGSRGVAGPALKKMLSDIGVLDPRFGWAEVEGRGHVMVSGPRAYVDRIERALQALPDAAGDDHVQVYRLKHASVDDRVIQYRDKQITTPGVATILRNLLSGAGGVGATTVENVETAASQGGAAETASSGGPSGSPAAAKAAESRTSPPREGRRGAAAPPAPVVQADSRLNAVIIRDRPQSAPVYRRLIEMLDVPAELVEIEAMIVDVNSSSVAELGVDWSLRSGSVSAAFGDMAAAGGGAGTIGIVSNAIGARIRALEGRGAARVVSRPSILTQDNLGALIDLADTFFIQTTGERVASVTPVSVGVTLKVTPRIVRDDARKGVQLVVDLEDGAIQDLKIGSLPTIRRSTIGTQALMRENESLVIGGFNAEQTLASRDQIPVLGDLPAVGPLFGKRVERSEKRERMFLITPRVAASRVAAPAGAGQ